MCVMQIVATSFLVAVLGSQRFNWSLKGATLELVLAPSLSDSFFTLVTLKLCGYSTNPTG